MTNPQPERREVLSPIWPWISSFGSTQASFSQSILMAVNLNVRPM